jgi:hypothetical protein
MRARKPDPPNREARKPTPSTFAELEAEATRQLAKVRAGAAVFGGIVAITFGGLSANLLNATPRKLLAVLATAVPFSEFAIARTFIAFYNCNEGLGRLSTEQKNEPLPSRQQAKNDAGAKGRHSSAFAVDEYHIGGEFYRLAIIMIVLTIVLFLIAAFGRPPVQIEQVVINPVRSAHQTPTHPIVAPTVIVNPTVILTPTVIVPCRQNPDEAEHGPAGSGNLLDQSRSLLSGLLIRTSSALLRYRALGKRTSRVCIELSLPRDVSLLTGIIAGMAGIGWQLPDRGHCKT